MKHEPKVKRHKYRLQKPCILENPFGMRRDTFQRGEQQAAKLPGILRDFTNSVAALCLERRFLIEPGLAEKALELSYSKYCAALALRNQEGRGFGNARAHVKVKSLRFAVIL